MAPPPPSSTTSIPPWKYDVFLSFRGEDTRANFTDHLYTSLTERGIRTFRDEEEIERGNEIAPGILKAIEESRFCVVVFSKGYAHSRWCLDELVKIIECVKENEQKIIPIFYHVDPSDVRKQTGSFGDAFVDLENQNDEKAKRWRHALREAGNISGWHLSHGYESKRIREVTNDICKRLNSKALHVGENIVGMGFHLDRLKSLINIESNEVRMIGIYGIGGIGKTTIAKAICNSISYQFDGTSFLEDIRETKNCHGGLLQLQQKILHDILRGRNMELHNVDEGISVIKDRLHSKRVLIVVDDVDNMCQLEHLVGKHEWFYSGSRIIITTRDKHLLDVHGVDETYEAKELNHEESIELFSRHAFKQRLPEDDYKNLSNRAIEFAKGLPLALKVLGNFLFNKTIPEWESSLCKLEKKLHSEIQNVLKISYDGLDDMEKDIFLDIACFFKGKDRDFVSRILDGCGFYAESGIRVLVDKCLLTISNSKLDMNDLLQHMGWEIVRNQSSREPGRRSRLWEVEDVYLVMTKKTGTEAIEGIILDMSSTSKQIEFTTEAFRKMEGLRLLKVHHDAQFASMVKYCKDVQIPKGLHLPGDFTFPSYDLRYLHWDGYPLKSLPSIFHGEHLVEVSLQSSCIEEFWEKQKVFEKLKVLNLSYSQNLVEVPDFSCTPNLEILLVKGCENLEEIPRGIHELKHLKTLSCSGCSKLRAFPEIMEVMENLREVYLDRTGIRSLPWSIVRLKGIQYLDLSHCENLETIPGSICSLKSLKTLRLPNCAKLDQFPTIPKILYDLGFPAPRDHMRNLVELDGFPQRAETSSGATTLNYKKSQLESQMTAEVSLRSIIDHSLDWLEQLDLSYCNLFEGGISSEVFSLPSLQLLNLSGNSICKLPPNITNLSNLRILNIAHCTLLHKIPELPSNLREIDAHGCPLLLQLQKQTQLWLSLFNCLKSNIQDLERGLGSSDTFIPGSLYDGKGISLLSDGICGVPGWIRRRIMGNEVTIQLPPDWYEDDDLLGFSLFTFHYLGGGDQYPPPPPRSLKCELSFLDVQFGTVDDLFLDYSCERCNRRRSTYQVWATYYPKVAVKEMFHSNEYRSLKATFRGTHLKVEECGIDLIYAPRSSQEEHPNKKLRTN